MDLAKFVVAVGIALVLMFFFSSALSTFYKPPKFDARSCSANCEDLIEQRCGEVSGGGLSGGESNKYFECQSDVLKSQEYKDCTKNSRNNYQKCFNDSTNKLENYQLIYYIILVFFAVIIIVLGFFLLHEESIGSGFIGGGVLLTISAMIFATIAIVTSSIMGLAGGLLGGFGGLSPQMAPQFEQGLDSSTLGITGAAISNVDKGTPAISYINVVVLLIILIILIVFAHYKLEKRSEMQVM